MTASKGKEEKMLADVYREGVIGIDVTKNSYKKVMLEIRYKA